MMQDRFCLALYRSDDPEVRAVAADKLNKAHTQAYCASHAKVAKSNLKNVNIILDDTSCCIPSETLHVCFASEVVH